MWLAGLTMTAAVASARTLNVIEGEADTTILRNVVLGEVVVGADPKMVGDLTEQPLSYSVLDERTLHAAGMGSLKQAALSVPNLFMPDYGSRLTSAIYIRGVGSRMNTPAVGMYVDGVAQRERSSFDISFGDVERVEVLPGPQSTLYGCNTMGGLIKVYTFNPLQTRTQGSQTMLQMGASTEDAGRYVRFRTAHKLGRDAAFSLSGFYDGNDGYNRNVTLGRKSNGGNAGGGKIRLVYNPQQHPGFTLDFQSSMEYSDENGYDYYKVADLSATPYSPGGEGLIRENVMGGYRRMLLNNSLRLESVQPKFVVSSVTGYQILNDRMFMDQDFSPLNMFTLEQKQRSQYLSEEIVLKSHSNDRFEWVGGGYLANQWLKTDAPVNFGADGIANLIQSGIDAGFAKANAAMNPMGMGIAMTIDDEAMLVNGAFDTPTFNAALFGQATLKNLLPGLDLTAGLRMDYEHQSMDYETGATSHFTFAMTRGGRPMMNKQFASQSRYHGDMRNDYTQWLPKVALSYRFSRDNSVYASVSKGFRSGGYNIQMFSDLVQTSLKNDMMATLADDPQLGAAMSRYMAIGTNPSPDSITVYKPETSWNYEVGTHLSLLDNHLTVNASAFFIQTRNQQISRFHESGLGRQMVNAGRSESYGAEIDLMGWCRVLGNVLSLRGSYGYTHATFKKYDGGEDKSGSHVYDGNYVPFAPQHQFALAADYTVALNDDMNVFAGVNANGRGKVYWTEDNTVDQPFYVLYGAHAGLRWKQFTLNVWGKNLTDKQYVPFYFTNLGSGYAQTARPRQFGIDLTMKF